MYRHLSRPGSEAGPGLLRRASLVDEVYEIIWDKIIFNDLMPGERLSDVTLAATLQVSRTPVREALGRLVKDGIVRQNLQRGFVVTTFSPLILNDAPTLGVGFVG